MQKLSRRNMLRGSLLATASLPFVTLNGAVEQWREREYAMPKGLRKDTPLVKLNSNENPYGPSAKAREAVVGSLDKGNRYPGTAIAKLRKQIATYENLSPDQILITAGSTELLGVMGLMAGVEGGRVLGCDPTFDFMLYFARMFGAEWVKVPLNENHEYNLGGLNEKLDSNTNLVFICNPNNPTGTELPLSVLKPFCQTVSERCLVYLDEAYIEFSKDGLKSSLASETANNKNLVIGRTFSKIYGLAGLRVGYAIGHPHTISRMKKHLMGRGITPAITSIAAASASLGDEEFLSHCRNMNATSREMVYDKFASWEVGYIPSSTSFILFETRRFGNADIVKELQRQNVLIRSYSHVPGKARVSMGTPEEMELFLDATEKVLT